MIREERENCCDDIVLNIMPQPRNYLDALIAFQGLESQAAGFAMALSAPQAPVDEPSAPDSL